MCVLASLGNWQTQYLFFKNFRDLAPSVTKIKGPKKVIWPGPRRTFLRRYDDLPIELCIIAFASMRESERKIL